MANANIKQIFQEFPSNNVNPTDKLVFYSESTGVTRAILASDLLGNTTDTGGFLWVTTAVYQTGDPVLFKGQWYISLIDDNTENIPTDGAIWQLENRVSAIVLKPYENGVYDTANSIVSVSNNIYRLKGSVTLPLNTNTSPDQDSANWDLIGLIEPVQKSGNEISFEIPEDYGTDVAPKTGALTDTNLAAKKGNPQKIYHQDTSLVVPADWVLIGGIEYEPGVLNLIVVEWERNDRKIYWIAQEA